MHSPSVLKLLREEIRDVDLDPQQDILTYEHPGIYDIYVASVIMHPQRKQHFLRLVNSIFDFWCTQAPARTIGRMYGRVIAKDGEMLAKKLFFSPIWHVAEGAYVLDLARPNPSRIVQSFQYCVQSKREEQDLEGE